MRSERVSARLRRRGAQLLMLAGLAYACTDATGPSDGDLTPPVITVEAVSTRAMRVQWARDTLNDIQVYEVERRENLSGAFSTAAEIIPGAEDPVVYIDTDVEPGTFYGYRVRSVARLGGTSKPSGIVGARTPSQPGIELLVTIQGGAGAGGQQQSLTARVTGPMQLQRTVPASAVTLLGPLEPGEYTLMLEGVSEGCSVVDGPQRTVAITDSGLGTVARVNLTVVCRDPTRGAIVVNVITAGDTLPPSPYTVKVVGTPNGEALTVTQTAQPAGSPGFFTSEPQLLNLLAGEYEISLLDVDVTICDVEGSAVRTVQAAPLSLDTIRYAVTCSRGDVDVDAPFTLRQQWDRDQAATGQQVKLFVRYDGSQRPNVEMGGTQFTLLFDTARVRLDSVAAGPELRVFGENLSIPGRATVSFGCDTEQARRDTATIARLSFTVRGQEGSRARTTTPKNEFIGFSSCGGEITVPPDSVRIVEDTLLISASTQNLPPTVDAGGPYTGTTAAAVSFTATGSDPDGSIVSWSWTFGDGGTATTQNPTHTYTTAGTYRARVTVMDNGALTATDSATVTISAPGGGGEPANYAWRNAFSASSVAPGGAFTMVSTVKPSVPVYLAIGNVSFDSTVIRLDSLRADPFWTTSGGNFTYNLPNRGIAVLSAFRLDNASANDPANAVRFVTMYFTAIGAGGMSAFTRTTNVSLGAQGGSEIPTGTLAIIEDTIAITGSTPPPPTNRAPVIQMNGPYQGTANTALLLRATGTVDPDGDAMTYRWDFGNGSQSAPLASTLTTVTYTTAGTYRLRLTVTDNRGASATDSTTVTITGANQPPVARANGPYSSQVNQAITFNAAGSTDPDGTIASYTWTFDGTTRSGSTVSHTYTTTGTFRAVLRVTDNGGLSSVDTAVVTVTAAENQSPVAVANGPYGGTAGQAISFRSTGSSDPDGSITTYLWIFGDGGITTGPSPTHVYLQAGTYSATLIVTDNQGATGAASAVVVVSAAGSGANVPPVAEANGPYSGTAGSAIAFSSAGSGDTDGSIASYAWTFGDGGTSTAANPARTYAAAGTYMARLTVIDNQGATARDSAGVTVTAPAPPPNQAPVAEAGGPYSGTAGTALAFSAAGSTDSDGSIASYAWTFGDGGTSTSANPSHTYATAGTYMARLEITDDDGATARDSAAVTVAAAAPTGFALRNEWSAAAPSVGQTVMLTMTTNPGQTVGAAQASVLFPSAILRADSVRQGSAGFSSPISNIATPGVATVSATSTNGVSGEAIIARIYFTVIASGNATTQTPRSELFIGDLGGEPIDVSGLPVHEASLTAGGG